MPRFWLVLFIACLALSESAIAPAHADGGEALLERLLDDSQVAKTATQNQPALQKAPATAASVRTKPREALRLTPDRTEILRLEQDAASVVVTNPAHAQVMMETPRLLLVMPRTPGSTSLFVLDKDGQTILERDIIISATTAPYVRIRKSCPGNSGECAANSYYYCPDGCYEVSTVPSDSGGEVPEITGQTPTIDAGADAGYVPPNARSRTEPAPLPLLDGEAGLETDSALDTPAE